jgi:histone deacetylation protein Rxt3
MGRELPALGSSNRPGSAFSISSILDTSSQPPGGPPPHSAGSPSFTSMRPPSPRRNQIPPRVDPPAWRRPETPEKYSKPLKPVEPGSYQSVSSPRYYPPGSRDSPEYNRAPTLSTYQPHPTPPRPSHLAQSSSPEKTTIRQLDDRYPARPNSQPAGYQPHPRDQEYISPSQQAPMRQEHRDHSDRFGGQEDQRPFVYSHQSPGHSAANERPPSTHSMPTSLYASASTRMSDDSNLLRRNLLGQEPIRDDSQRDYGPSKREEYGSPLKTSFRSAYYSQPTPTSTVEAPRSHPNILEALRRPPEPFTSQDQIPQQTRSAFEPDRFRDDALMRRSESRDSRRLGGEEMQQSRSLLGISSEPNKRGRASPLPQAVKGAQAQLLGPGSDPSIKSEFGRLFQGLGSGLGGPGNLTPSRQSPVPQRMRDEVASGHLSDNEGVKMTRIGSQAGRGLGRRPRDESARPELEEGRRTPVVDGIIGRPAKRARLGQAVHTAVEPRNDLQVTQAPLPLLAKPTLSISSTSLLSSIANKRRVYCGSCVYKPHAKTSPFASSGPDDFFFSFRLPRRFLDSEINNLYTVRVPRWYLTRDTRRKVCEDKYLFGSEVYTDDSDPLAAAIHSGWIRGAWSERADESLMDLPPEVIADAPSLKDRVFDRVPEVPLTPPDGLDAQITVLVLPSLAKYGASLRYGVKSRAWPGTHDGLSFMVVKLVFVDERSRVGIEKGAKARKERMKRLQGLKGAAVMTVKAG